MLLSILFPFRIFGNVWEIIFAAGILALERRLIFLSYSSHRPRPRSGDPDLSNAMYISNQIMKLVKLPNDHLIDPAEIGALIPTPNVSSYVGNNFFCVRLLQYLPIEHYFKIHFLYPNSS